LTEAFANLRSSLFTFAFENNEEIGPLLAAQKQAGLIEAVARLKPWLTFKA